MYIIHHIHHVIQRDISTNKLRIHNKITILTTQDSNTTLLFKHVYVYAINISYENKIQFVLINNTILILTISNSMGKIPMHTF